MTATDSRLSYADCYELMDQALIDDKGLRVKYATHGDAWAFRLRLHNARRIDRKDNAKTYDDPEHPMHGRSVYDQLVIRLRSNQSSSFGLLEVEKVTSRSFEVESLTDGRGFTIQTDAEPMEVPEPVKSEAVPVKDLDFLPRRRI